MNRIYFPGCRIKKRYPEASAKLSAYLKETYGLEEAGCCKTDYLLLNQPDTEAVLICNNCIHDLSALTTNTRRTYVLDLIDQDPNFPFPDHSGKTYVLQDCGHGYGDQPADQTVRSLLKKMNITFREQPESARASFGLEGNAKAELIKANCESFPEEDVIVYCAICHLYMNQNGKNPVHILDLLFDC